MMLRLTNVTLSYGKTPILRNISLTCKPGTITTLIGSNGTGKSTLLKACGGLLPISGGTLLCSTTNIGYITEQCALPAWLTAYDALWYAAQFANKQIKKTDICTTLKMVNLENFACKAIATFSKGMKQRLAFAELLVCDPPVILLDEPFSGLDTASNNTIAKLIGYFKTQQKTILCTAHKTSEIIADEYYCINQQKVARLQQPESVLPSA